MLTLISFLEHYNEDCHQLRGHKNLRIKICDPITTLEQFYFSLFAETKESEEHVQHA